MVWKQYSYLAVIPVCVVITAISCYNIYHVSEQDDAQRSLQLADDDIKYAQDQIEKFKNEAMALKVRQF